MQLQAAHRRTIFEERAGAHETSLRFRVGLRRAVDTAARMGLSRWREGLGQRRVARTIRRRIPEHRLGSTKQRSLERSSRCWDETSPARTRADTHTPPRNRESSSASAQADSVSNSASPYKRQAMSDGKVSKCCFIEMLVTSTRRPTRRCMLRTEANI